MLVLISPLFAMRELSEKDMATLVAGSTVLKQNPSTPWPTMVVYRKVNASPHEVLKLFADYENAPSFAKSLNSAKIIASSPDGLEKTVRYEVKIPLLPSISYVVKNKQDPADLSVSWKKVESSIFSEIRGEMIVRPHESGSIIRYTSTVQPSSRLAYPFGGAIPRQAQEIVENFANEVEKNSR